MTNNSSVLSQVQAFPDNPGIYMMRDGKGAVIYVGKASRLKDRIRSYFASPVGLSPKTRRLVATVADLEYIVTDSEAEALLMECNLIKKFKPRFNVRLRDDKQYPYLKVTVQEDWPQVLITRRVENDGARYFGPYTNSGSVRQTMALVQKLFPYRSCNKLITGTDLRPCLDFHIHRCLGPCIGAVLKEEYAAVIEQVILFLEGKQELVARELRKKMLEAVGNLEFERAAVIRDQIKAVERVVEHQKMVSVQRKNVDAIAFAQMGSECCMQIFQIRDGKLFGREHFVLEGTQDETPSTIMTSFVQQYYTSASNIPSTIFMQYPVDDSAALIAWLRQERKGGITLQVPSRGEKKELIDLVAENARQTLQQLHVRWLADSGKTAAALTELQDILDLPRLPRRMECYDISTISGTSAVGSMVVFEDGRPKPSSYRRFRIKGSSGPDDYGMMQEMLRRRFKRAKEDIDQYIQADNDSDEESSDDDASDAAPLNDGWSLPDLVVIDGGRGHLNAATEVMRELGVHVIPICALAKQQEEVFLPHVEESVLPPKDSQGLYLMQRIRDEAHRFAITYHRTVRSKAAIASVLDEVSGIGPKRKKALLQRFGSTAGIKSADVDDIAAVPGMTRALAEKMKAAL